MTVYFISGLAADSRVFKHIRLPAGYTKQFLEWFPASKGETLRQYALRMSDEIKKDEPFILIGLSMGGMIATEIANHFPPKRLILISSTPSARHFPPFFKLAFRLRLHNLFPVSLLKAGSIQKRMLSKEKTEDKIILLSVIRESDPDLIRWALGAILSWNNSTVPEGLVQIHGSRDEILPLKYSGATHIIPNGKHLMVMEKAEEINEILFNILA